MRILRTGIETVKQQAIRAAMRVPVLRARAGDLAKLPFNPYSPAFRADPYPYYHRLRQRDPVHQTGFGFWLVTRYEDALTVWQDSRFGHPPYAGMAKGEERPGAIATLRSNYFISMNPPDHTRLRKVVKKHFSAEATEALRSKVEDVVDGLLDRLEPAGGMDVMADLAYPLPLAIISGMLGIPFDDTAFLKVWVRDLFNAFDVVLDSAKQERSRVAAEGMLEYLRAMVDRRRREPGEDLVSSLLEAQREDPRFTENELVSTCALLFVAGHETSRGLIANAVLSLLRHRDQWELLRKQPSLIGGAIEESLRFDTPVQFIGRMALEDVSLGGKLIRKGRTVFILIGAVNRDPEVFPEPDRLDITRAGKRHLSFGSGIHTCIGSMLARLEGEIAIGKLVERMPNLRLRSRRQAWEDVMAARIPKSLPVAF